MDYSVKYKIDVNGAAASKELTAFQSTASKLVPKVNSKFSKLNKSLDVTLKKLRLITSELKRINQVDVHINARQATSDIDKIKQSLKGIKGKTVNIRVKETTPGVSKSKRGGFFSRFRGGTMKNSGGMFSPTSFMSAGGIPYATTIGAGMLGLALRNIISESVKFKDTMTTVHNILGVGQEDIGAFENKFSKVSLSIRKIGVDTKFSATEIASASKYLAMAGMNLDTIGKTMRPITSLAAIGNHDLGEVADVVTNIMAGYKIAGKDMGKVSDVIAYSATHSNTNVMEMAESFKYAGSYLSSVGVDFRESAAAIGVLADSGRKGTLSGTGLRAMVIRLLKPTAKAKKVIDKLGLSFFHMGKNGKQEMNSLVDIFSDFKKVGASAEDITAIFDKVAGGAAMQLAKNVDKLRSLTSASSTSGGLANYLAAEKMKTVAGLSDQIRSKFLDLGLTMYNKIEPTLKRVMNSLLSWMKSKSASKLFDTISNGISSTIKGISALTKYISSNWGWLKYVLGGYAAVSGVMALTKALLLPLASVGKLLVGINGIGKGITGILGMSASMATPMGALAVAVVAVGTAAFFAYRKFTEANRIKNEFFKVSENETDGWNSFTALDALTEKLNNIANAANQSGIAMNDMLKGQEFGKAAKKMANTYNGVFEWSLHNGSYSIITKSARQGQRDLLSQLAKTDAKKYEQKAFFGALISGKSPADIIGKQTADVQVAYKRRIAEARKKNPHDWKSYINDYDIYRGFSRTPHKESDISLSSMSQVRGGGFYLQQLAAQLSSTSGKSASNLFSKSGTRGGLLEVLEAQNILPAGMASALSNISPSLLKKNKDANMDARRAADLSAVMSDIQTRFPSFSVYSLKNMMVKMGFATKQVDSFLAKRLPALASLTRTDIATSGKFDKLKSTFGASTTGDSSATDYVGAGNVSTGKAIIVNIDKLWNVEEANFASKEDLETAKSTIASALMDVVKDFEISNF